MLRQATSIVHLHIPRTGGTSLRNHLRRSGLTVVSDHLFWGDEEPRDDRVFLVVLRDPLERVRSLYDFHRQNPNHAKHAWFSTASLDSVLAKPRIESTEMSNGQVRQLTGRHLIGHAVAAAHLEAAWTTLRRPDVIVTLTEHLNDALPPLAERLGVAIPPLQQRLNAYPRTYLNPATADRILNLNRWDNELVGRVSGGLRKR